MSEINNDESANAPAATETITTEETVKGSLYAALGGFEGNDPPKKEEDDATPTETPQAVPEEDINVVTPDLTETPQDGPRISAKDLRVKKREKPAAPAAPKATDPTPDPTPAPDPKPAKSDYSAFAERERETLELIEFGESKELAEKGISKQVAKYYEDRAKFLEDLSAENYEDEDFNPQDDPKYKLWAAKNRPPFDINKLERIRNERLIDDAKERALTEFRKESKEKDDRFQKYIEDQERERVRPEVEREVAVFSDNLLSELDPEVTKAYAEKKDWAKVEEDIPIEAPIIRQVLNEYTDKAEVLMSIASGMTKLDPSNPTHSSLQRFISKQAELYGQQDPVKTSRDGKAFVHPKDFVDSNSQWTFTKEDMVSLLSRAAKKVAETRISTEKKKFEAMLRKRGLTAQEAFDAANDDSSSPSVKPTAAGDRLNPSGTNRRTLMDIL